MIEDAWALPVSLYSVILKREAVVRSLPGGIDEFEQTYRPGRKNGALFMVFCRSLGEVENVRSQLIVAGLLPAKEFTVADMMHGPLEEHTGFGFHREGEFPNIRWTVSAIEQVPEIEGRVFEPPKFPPRTYHFVKEEGGGQKLLVVFDKDKPGPNEIEKPRRVVFRTGPVHWLYSDDEEGEDERFYSSPLAPKVERVSSERKAKGSVHEFRVQYTDGMLASHDCWDVTGEVVIKVSGTSLEQIRSGAGVDLSSLPVRVLWGDPDIQWDTALWRFNDPEGGCTIFLPQDGDADDWLEAVATWVDDIEQSVPPRYWDE